MRSEAELRQDLMAIVARALAAVEPSRLTHEALAGRHKDLVAVPGKIWIAGFGKAAVPMARGALEALGPRVAGGVLVVPEGSKAVEKEALGPLDVHVGGHPLPTEGGIEGARAVRALCHRAAHDDLVLCLVSGGGSALLTLPPEHISLADICSTMQLLQARGASIEEVNCVRKQLDTLKAGRLAQEAAPASLLSLILSDVPGDALDVIASGPTVPSTTGYREALAVLDSLRAWEDAPLTIRSHLERGARGELPPQPGPGDPCFARTEALVIGNGQTAARAALAAAQQLGYRPHLLATTLTGEAKYVGTYLASVAIAVRRTSQPIAPPACLVAAGETTVSLTPPHGIGGRNQELALAAAENLNGLPAVLVASIGTDGIDGPSDAAGALATGSTLLRARQAGASHRRALAQHDAYPFFKAVGDLIVTGPTGTNVADLQIVLVGAD
jgi:hydroxypyruvate reductase